MSEQSEKLTFRGRIEQLGARVAGSKAGRWLWNGRALAALALVAIVALRVNDPCSLRLMRFEAFDLIQQSSPRVADYSKVAIVDIDEASIAELGQWPWARSTIARLVDNLNAAGARAIGFDMVFSEPDRLSPDKLSEQLNGLPPVMRGMLAQMPSTDTTFARSIARAPVILGMSARIETEAGVKGAAPAEQVVRRQPTPMVAFGGDPRAHLFGFPSLLRNVPELENAGKGLGLFSLTPEHDGVVRRVPAALRVGPDVHPSLSLEMLRVAAGADSFGMAVDPEAGGVTHVRLAGQSVPTDRNGRVWLHFAEHAPDLYISAKDVVSRRINPNQIRGKLVLVGTSAVGLRDLRQTALGETVPGVEVHAQLIDTVLGGAYLSRPHVAETLEHLIAVLGALALIAATPALSAARALPLFLLLVGGMSAGAWLAFTEASYALDPTYPLLAWSIVFAALAYSNYSRVEAQRRQVRDAFSHYLSPDLVKQLADAPDTLKVGGESREMTFLFCDLAGFTTFVEQADPATLVRLLNEYLDGLCGVVMKHGGTIDKIVGDAVHAMFNAPLDEPLHAEKAVTCALEIEAFVNDFRARMAAQGIDFGTTRIGVNTGVAVVGNFGGQRRFDYTAHGDAINTAARLEGANKFLGTGICISETTVEQCQTHRFRPIGGLRLKGKGQVVNTFEPIRGAMCDAAVANYAAAFELLAAEQPEAHGAFEVLVEALPNDPLVALHWGRLSHGEAGANITMAGK